MADAAAAATDDALAAPPSPPSSALQPPFQPPPPDTLMSDATPSAAETPNLPDSPFSDAALADASDADASGVAAPPDDDGTNPLGGAMKHMTLAPPAPPSKKSKKKNSNSVWTRPTSRKGKKKAKQPANALAGGIGGSGGRLPKPSSDEDELVLTPAPRFAAERNDDAPDLPMLLSRVFKTDKVEVSDDRLTAGSKKGYRMVRATRGVAAGAWYFEVKVLHLGSSGHTRLGWATNNADIHVPVGYDVFGFGYRDMDGTRCTKRGGPSMLTKAKARAMLLTKAMARAMFLSSIFICLMGSCMSPSNLSWFTTRGFLSKQKLQRRLSRRHRIQFLVVRYATSRMGCAWALLLWTFLEGGTTQLRQCIHCLINQTAWSDSTLVPILSSLQKILEVDQFLKPMSDVPYRP